MPISNFAPHFPSPMASLYPDFHQPQKKSSTTGDGAEAGTAVTQAAGQTRAIHAEPRSKIPHRSLQAGPQKSSPKILAIVEGRHLTVDGPTGLQRFPGGVSDGDQAVPLRGKTGPEAPQNRVGLYYDPSSKGTNRKAGYEFDKNEAEPTPWFESAGRRVSSIIEEAEVYPCDKGQWMVAQLVHRYPGDHKEAMLMLASEGKSEEEVIALYGKTSADLMEGMKTWEQRKETVWSSLQLLKPLLESGRPFILNLHGQPRSAHEEAARKGDIASARDKKAAAPQEQVFNPSVQTRVINGLGNNRVLIRDPYTGSVMETDAPEIFRDIRDKYAPGVVEKVSFEVIELAEQTAERARSGTAADEQAR